MREVIKNVLCERVKDLLSVVIRAEGERKTFPDMTIWEIKVFFGEGEVKEEGGIVFFVNKNRERVYLSIEPAKGNKLNYSSLVDFVFDNANPKWLVKVAFDFDVQMVCDKVKDVVERLIKKVLSLPKVFGKWIYWLKI